MALAEQLHRKGWSPAEIEHALHHLRLAEERKEPLVKFSETSTYWLLLIAIILSVGGISTVLLPFLKLIPEELSYIIIALIGAVCGVLYAHVLHDIDELTHRHHVAVLIVTAIAALAWSYYKTGSVAFGAIFAGLFCSQYLLYWWKK